MPELDDISYSRDECIAAVRDYYDFLVKMYLEDSAIIEPPKDGWPSVTRNSLRGLEKTDKVILLLRHLPYITTPYEQGLAKPNGSPFCYWADWKSYAEGVTERRLTTATLKICSEGADFGDAIPAHVIGLTYGGRQNPVFLLDTELGIIYWIECPDEIKNNPLREMVEDNPEDFAPENEVEWRSESPAWAISDFFELLKDHFRILNFLPISSKTVIDVWVPSRPSGLFKLVQDIYREHSWPDLGQYRKQECLEALQTALEEQYPDGADWRKKE